jgi:hypothetical protein
MARTTTSKGSRKTSSLEVSVVPPDAAALIFEKSGMSLMLPSNLKPTATMPDHMVACAAIGARLMADDEWAERICKEAGEWLDSRLEGLSDTR